MKTDLYTKIVLTVIAVALTANLLKDVDFVTKAHAGELDLSNMKIEKAANANDDGEITFFIYENSKISNPFSKNNYRECSIANDDVPTHIITNKKVSRSSYTYFRRVE
jgi:hypothetical protein